MKFIIPSFVGAIIGYITNWLAIKMLFRPRYKKVILGRRVPFTPGLIPKERERIAASIGNAVGIHLLSSETFTDIISQDKTKDKILTWIKSFLDKLRNNSNTIENLGITIWGKKYDDGLQVLENKIVIFICRKLSNEKSRSMFRNIFEDKIYKKCKDEVFDFVIKNIGSLIQQLAESQNVKENLDELLDSKIKALEEDTRTLEDIIPNDIKNMINDYIVEHKDELNKALKKLIEDPFVKRKLKTTITEVVAKNTSKIITVFMSPESIAQKVISSIETYFDDNEEDDSVVLVINTLLDKILETEISDLLKGISSENKNQISLQISNIINDYIRNNETQNKLISVLGEKIALSEGDIKEGIMNFMENKLDISIKSPNFKDKIHNFVHNAINIITTKPLNIYLEQVNENTIANIASIATNIFSNFIESKVPDIIEALDIAKIVENKINSFDVNFVEEMIIEIANKELAAITWLGALLGGILGLISPLLQYYNYF